MSVETKPNKLTKGLVLDTFHTDVDNTVATYALNSQLEDQEGNHFHYGSEVGTTYIKDIPDNHVVIGHINMERNETVLFTTDGTNSTIGILSRKDDMSYNYEIKVDDSKQEKKLGFKKDTYIRGVYRLLNGCDKIIYFVDGINKDRRINLNQLDSYKLPTTASVASGIIFDDSLRATVFALSSATGNIQLIRLLSASPEATANVLANLSLGDSLTKLLEVSANGIGTAFANLIRTANIVSSIEATGTSTVNVDIVRLLQSNVSAIGSVNAILESTQQGVVQIDVTLSGVALSTATLLRAALLETNVTAQATTIVDTIVTKIIDAQVQALANTESSAQISIPISATVNAIANTTASAILSSIINATVNATVDTSATVQLSKVISTSVDALANSSSEALIGLVLVSTNIASASTSTINLIIGNSLTSSVTAQGTTTAELIIAELLSSTMTATANTTANSLVSKLLSSTVSSLATTTSSLQLADVLTSSVSAAATVNATLTSAAPNVSVDYLVVAGGGGGGHAGGGGGGYKTASALSVPLNSATSIIIGGGGNGSPDPNSGTSAQNGSNSVFSSITSNGGGAGASFNDGSPYNGFNGGSGGGGTYGGGGGAGTSGQGNNGGSSLLNSGYAITGGGGGAGAVGGNGVLISGAGLSSSIQGGNGGNGLTASITGLTYSGGGGGGADGRVTGSKTPGTGGTGGGAAGVIGDNATPNNGTANRGGGGGGNYFGANIQVGAGGNGGSGVVVIKIPNTYVAKFSSGCTVNGETSSVPFIPANLSTSEIGFNTYNVTSTTTVSETVTFVSAADIDLNAAAFFTRVTTAGGTLTSTEQSAVDTLVKSLKSNAIWSKMKAIYPMVGASAAACKQNLKSSSFTGSFTGCTFASTGVTPNGTSGYMDTNLNVLTSLSPSSLHYSFYSRTNNNTTGYDIGHNNTVFNIICRYQSGSGYISYNGFRTFAVTNSTGFYLGSRLSGNHKGFKNNVNVVNATGVADVIFENLNLLIFADNRLPAAGGILEYASKECAFASVGTGLTDTEASNFYTAVQTFQQTLNRNV